MKAVLLKIVVFLLNTFGTLNFQFNPIKQRFEARKIYIVLSVFVLILLQLNKFSLVNDSDAGHDGLLDFIESLDYLSWGGIHLIYVLDKIIQGHRYVNLMNELFFLKKECSKDLQDVSKFYENFQKNIYMMCTFQVLIHLFYAVLKIFRSPYFLHSMIIEWKLWVYSETLIFVILSNVIVEVTFLRNCEAHFDILSHNVQLLGINNLRTHLNLFEKFFLVVKELKQIFTFVKIAQICFVFASTTVYAFYIYYSFINPIYLAALFWLFQTLLIAGSWHFWGRLFNKVSAFPFLLLLYIGHKANVINWGGSGRKCWTPRKL